MVAQSGQAADMVVGIVGCGTMGLGIAQVALQSGARVIVHDVSDAARDRAPARLREHLERQYLRSGMQQGEAYRQAAMDLRHLEVVPALDPLAASADVVIEAVVEDIPTKEAVFAGLARAARGSTILASNTSALSVQRIAAATPVPERVIGLHFFNPVPAMELVEVVATAVTDPGVVERAERLVTSWGKRAIRCHDTPGFIVNRVNRPFTLEALSMLEDGLADVDAIDTAVREAGYPLGPFELMDLIGIDVNLAVAEAIHRASIEAGDPLAERFRPSEIQRRKVAEGRIGRKSGEGFYRYPRETTRASAPPSGSLRELARPIVLAIILEAYRASDARIASRTDIDLALRLGARHPAGPFESARLFGPPTMLLAAAEESVRRGPRFEIPEGLRAEAVATT